MSPASVSAVALSATFTLLLMVACSSRPDDSEVAVCASLQGIVDDLVQKNNEGALTGLSRLQEAVAGTDNERLASEGRAFFAQIGRRVDMGPMTIGEIRQVGEETLRQGSGKLEAMLDECREVGAAVDRLPASSD